MCSISCGNNIIDEKYLFVLKDILLVSFEQIFQLYFFSFFFCPSRLMSCKELFCKRTENVRRPYAARKNGGKLFGMIWSAENPIFEADRRIHNDGL